MLNKTCKCGKTIGYGERCCSECAKDRKMHTVYYDQNNRDKQSYAFYHSAAWIKTRAYVMSMYSGLCLYSLYVLGTLVPADVVHHITELNEDRSKALDLNNLIPLCGSVHSSLHSNYKESDRTALRKLLEKWKNEQK